MTENFVNYISIFDAYDISFVDFAMSCVLLLATYFILLFLYKTLKYLPLNKGIFSKSFKAKIFDFFHDLILWYEPVALVLIIILFVMINPRINFFVLLFFLIFFYWIIKNYISGRFVKASNRFSNGTVIEVNGVKGIIEDKTLFGIYLLGPNGNNYVPYDLLEKKGFIVHSGVAVGSNFKFKVELESGKSKQELINAIEDLCFNSPYVDRKRKVSVKEIGDQSISVECSLVSEKYKYALISVLNENNINLITEQHD